MVREALRNMKNENGLSLIELVMGLGLMLFVLQGAFAFFYFSNESVRTSMGTMQTRSEIENVTRRIEEDVREARSISEVEPALEITGENEFVFFTDSDEDGEPERIRYFLDGADLRREVTTPTPGGPPWDFSGAARISTLSTMVRNTSGEPVFTYFSYEGTEPIAPPLDAAQRASVRLITIHLVVDQDIKRKPGPISMETDIFMRNLARD